MATEASQGQKPVMSMFGPEWWHHHGMKVGLIERDFANRRMWLKGSAAELRISKVQDSLLWNVTWKVVHGPNDDCTGRLHVSSEVLLAAFGLKDVVWPGSEWLVKRFGASAAFQGQFIRWDRFLNIPGPGTGHDGDPNISIELDDDIRRAVGGMVLQWESPAP